MNVCGACAVSGGFEGEPPAEPTHLVTIVAPEGPAAANEPQGLCASHANQAVNAYLGYGWGVTAALIAAEAASGVVARPEGYDDDAGIRLIYDCLHDRGLDPAVLVARMDAYTGDYWFDFVGPMLDRVEGELFAEPVA